MRFETKRDTAGNADADRGLAAIPDAIDAIRRGEIIAVVDDETRENEGDLVMAAEHATVEKLAFYVRETCGIICAPLNGDRCDALRLPQMVERNADAHGTAFTTSVDLAHGTTTGVSAADRAATLRALALAGTRPEDLTRPGHVFPLRARRGGVLERAGHTEAAVDLARLAGCTPAGVISEIVARDGSMARLPELRRFAREHGLLLISVADLMTYRYRTEKLVRHVATADVPTAWGPFSCRAYESLVDGVEHLAFVRGDVSGDEAVLVRVHSECLTGDVFGSRRCDCGAQLQAALCQIAEAGAGALVYLRGHEGRGIGLGHKIRAYSLQEQGYDTVDANLELGLPVDDRHYGVGTQILADLGIHKLRLMTNNPAKYSGLADDGLELVERVPIGAFATAENVAYLSAKKHRLGHLIDLSEPCPAATVGQGRR